MKLIDADKMREWLETQIERGNINYKNASQRGDKNNGRDDMNNIGGRLHAYEAMGRYVDDHEYDEELIITHNEHGWFCTDGRDDIHGWDRESKQKAIALFHRRVKEKADAADQSRS